MIAEAEGGGARCTLASGEVEVGECNAQPCPVHCEGWWAPVGTCSKLCGGGTQRVAFYVEKEAAHGGRACDTGVKSEFVENGVRSTVVSQSGERTEPCNTKECPRDCEGAWTEWGKCSAACGIEAGGVKTRKYEAGAVQLLLAFRA